MKDFRIYLAPLRGVTDAVFRNTLSDHFNGIDMAITPFLSTTKGTRIKPSHIREVLPENNCKMPVVPQIMSKRAENFIPLTMALADLGYDCVNWNLGCPYPMVARKGRGSGLLSNPEAIQQFLDSVLAVIPGQLSIKMRLGRQREDEILKLLPILNQYPLKEVIIHPRTGVQMYEGKPRLKIFEQCLTLCRHSVIYNGDIIDKSGFDRLRRRFSGLHTWMIGRGAVTNPFLCGALSGEVLEEDEKTQKFKRFHDDLYQRYAKRLNGPSHLLNRMKGLWTYFSQSFEQGQGIQKRIHKTQHVHHYEQIVNTFFDHGPRWKSADTTNNY